MGCARKVGVSRGLRFAQTARTAAAGLMPALVWCVPAASAVPARAGVYDVYTCARPDGQPAPADGWSGSTSGPYMGAFDTCAEGGSLTAALDGSPAQPVSSAATWTFAAPAGESIAAATLWRAYSALSIAPGSAETVGDLNAPNDSYDSADVFDQCREDDCGSEGDPASRFAAENKVVVPSSFLQGATHIYASAACGGEPGTSCPEVSAPNMAQTQVLAAQITLQDEAPPSASAVGGSLTTAGVVLEGPQSVLITASDPGPGVYQAIFQIDGQTVAAAALDNDGGRCQNIGESSDGNPAFLYLQPCPAQVNSVDVAFNPALAAEGPHELRVLVSDAAGNTTTILDRQVVIDTTGAYTTTLARGACNGSSCDEHAQLIPSTKLHERVTRRYARSALTLEGRLLDHTGAPIGSAQVQLREQTQQTGAALAEIATATTDANGDWLFRLPKGPSRLVQVAYFSHLKDATPAVTLDYEERVRAAIRIHAPRRVRLGRAALFEGQLLGGLIPKGGEPVQLEIYYLHRWRTIEVLHTDRLGQFAYRYIFTLGAGLTYRFRALVQYSPAYPFLPAASRTVAIHVR